MVAGVCGGLADYFDVDPTVVRVAFVLLTIFNGTGIALYILMWILVPERGQVRKESSNQSTEAKVEADVEDAPPISRVRDTQTRAFWGLILVLLGGVLLLQQILPWQFDGALLVPTVLVAVGLVIVARSFES